MVVFLALVESNNYLFINYKIYSIVMPTALRNHQAIYSLKRGNYFPDILPTIFYWPHNAIAMLNRLMQLFVQSFSQCMNLQCKFSDNSDRHLRWKPSQRSLPGIGKFQLLTPRMWKRAEKKSWTVSVATYVWLLLPSDLHEKAWFFLRSVANIL